MLRNAILEIDRKDAIPLEEGEYFIADLLESEVYTDEGEKLGIVEDIFNTGMAFIDNDEFAEFLVPENNITEFWNLNTAFVDTFKNYVYAWSNRLAKLIKLKYQKSDVNLLPKRRYQRPQDKTATYIEVDDD